MSDVTRRFLLLALPGGLAACVATGGGLPPTAAEVAGHTGRYPQPPPGERALYAATQDSGRLVPATDLTLINPAFLRREVIYATDEAPGTIVVDTAKRYLYLVEGGGRALRYGIGVGREGFAWSGRATIARKAKWPSWYPPVEMQARDERARKWAHGMPGGIANPLGARAHYLYQNGRDTLFRIHGTSEPWTIGTNVSSGCIRMINQDVIDLYERVPVGTQVVVLDRDVSMPLPPILGSLLAW